MVALMGPSGAGKTTLLNSLAGRTGSLGGAAIEGQVRYGGRPLSQVGSKKALEKHVFFFFGLGMRT